MRLPSPHGCLANCLAGFLTRLVQPPRLDRALALVGALALLPAVGCGRSPLFPSASQVDDDGTGFGDDDSGFGGSFGQGGRNTGGGFGEGGSVGTGGQGGFVLGGRGGSPVPSGGGTGGGIIGGSGGGGSGGMVMRFEALIVTPPNLSFPDTVVGRRSEPRPFTVRNIGNLPVPIKWSVGQSPREFPLYKDGCLSSLLPGASCDVYFHFGPQSPGARTGVFEVFGPTTRASATMSGTGLPRNDGAAILRFDPGETDFGRLFLFQSVSKTYVLRNVGEGTSGVVLIELHGMIGSGLNLPRENCRRSLAPMESCTVVIEFRPKVASVFRGTLTASATPGGRSQVESIVGTGVAREALRIEPKVHDFGAVPTGTLSAPGSLEVFNDSDFPVGPLSVATNAPFVVTDDSCSMRSVPGFGSCSIQVNFQAPLDEGPVFGGVTVSTDDAKSSAELRAIAVADFPEGLVARYTFDEGNGHVVQDAQNNRSPGSIVRGAGPDAALHPAPGGVRVAGLRGSALSFDGLAPDWVRVPATDVLNRIGAFTVGAWIRVSRFATFDNWVVSRQLGPVNFQRFALGLSSGRPAMRTLNTTFLAPGDFPVDDQWHHLAASYDGVQLRLFVDGTLVGATVGGVSFGPDMTPMVFGAQQTPDGATGFFSGAFDEVLLFDRALPGDELERWVRRR
jgi:hypothetical protein